MDDSFKDFTDKPTLGEDGAYRWYYDMDMYKNRSMLYTLLKVNLILFLCVSFGGALLIGLTRGRFDDPMVRGIIIIGIIMCALLSVLYVIGFYIAARIKGGRYRIHFIMRDDDVEIAWSDRLKDGFDTGKKVLSLAGSIMGSRTVRGRWRPSMDEVSKTSFSTVFSMKSYPKWDMIDLSMPGGKFQVYAQKDDFSCVEAYIRERIPERARPKLR